jgi:hypothetical protein
MSIKSTTIIPPRSRSLNWREYFFCCFKICFECVLFWLLLTLLYPLFTSITCNAQYAL